MPTYTYAARDPNGAAQTGQLEALDEEQVVALLQHRGLLVTSVSRRELAASPSQRLVARQAARRRMHRGITVDDQVLLCQQLATLVDAGVPLLRSLAVVSAQVESQRLLLALEDIRREIEGGRTFHDGLSKHPEVFSSLWLSLVETGEASGHLAQSLQQLARHFESARHLQDQAKTALTYPAFLVVVAIAVVAIFVYWLIPKFTVMFSALNVELPLITRIVIAVSEAARRYVVALVLGVGLLGYVLRRYLRTDAGRWMRDRLLLRLPALHRLFAAVQLAEFARGLATLLDSGVPLLSSLDILHKSAANKVYGQAIGQVRDAVKEGKSMAEPMEDTGLFPPMTVQMVQVGEEVGELGKMTGRIAQYYEERVETFIARMTRLFEPIGIVVMGVLVLLIVLSIFVPIFKLAGSAGTG